MRYLKWAGVATAIALGIGLFLLFGWLLALVVGLALWRGWFGLRPRLGPVGRLNPAFLGVGAFVLVAVVWSSAANATGIHINSTAAPARPTALPTLAVSSPSPILSPTSAPVAPTSTATPIALPTATSSPLPATAVPTSVPSPTPVQIATATSAPVSTTSAAASIGIRTKSAGCQVRGPLPDPACSPGAIFPGVTAAQICVSGYARDVRDVPQAEKDEVYQEYGITSHSAGQYEVDHLISLELGGSNDIANLWPEAADPRPGFHEKDKVENYLHDQVCAGTLDLATAQQEIATDWISIYQTMGGSESTSATASVAASPTPTSVAITEAAPTAAEAPSNGRTYYLSSYRTAHEYYCDDDPGWKKLDPKYLVHLPSLEAVQQEYPGRTLHQPC